MKNLTKRLAAFGLSVAVAIAALPFGSMSASAGETDKLPNKLSIKDYVDTNSTGDYIAIGYDYDTPTSKGASGMLKATAYDSAYRTVDELVNYYPATRDQNPYGTCWAFSTVSLAEFDMVTKGYANRDVYYSPLQLAYFTYHTVTDPLGGTKGDSNSIVCQYGVPSYLDQGGNQYYAMRVLSGWTGVANEYDVPYSWAGNTIYGGIDPSYAYGHNAANLMNAQMVNINTQPLAVKQGIIDHGAVGISYYADPSLYSTFNYNGQDVSTFYYNGAGDYGANHAVTVVGWDDNFPSAGFYPNPYRNGAWLVRNSWTTEAGNSMSSYFWLSYADQGLADAAYIMDFAPAGTYQKLYQYDGGFMAGGAPEVLKKAANVFKTKSSAYGEQIEAVQLSVTNATDVGYKIQVYTNLQDKKKPTSGTLAATKTGRTTYAGVYTVRLDAPVEVDPGELYSIVLTQDSGSLDIEADFNMAASYGFGYVCEATPSGNSYFYYNGKWMNSNYFTDGGDFCIRALTNNSTSVHTPKITAVENVSNGVKITWNKVAGASKYVVQRSTNKKNWKNVKTVSKNSVVDTAVKGKNGSKYFYRVIINADTQKISGTKNIVRLSTPKLSSASNSSSRSITVKYSKNAKVNGYQIQYSLKKNFSSGVKTVKVGGAGNVSKTIKGLKKGKTYYVHVRSYKGKVYSGWSATKKVKISR